MIIVAFCIACFAGPEPSDSDDVQRISLSVQEEELRTVVARLAEMADINIVGGAELKGKVTAEFRDVPIGKAIDTVLRINGYGLVRDGRVFTVVSQEDASRRNRTTRLVYLEHARAEAVKESLDAIRKSMEHGDRVSITAHKRSNVLIIEGPAKVAEKLESAGKNLDKKPTSKPRQPEKSSGESVRP